MKPITDTTAVARLQKIADAMTVARGSYERDLNPAWLHGHGWKVVPVKSEISHFSPKEIERIVPALNRVGYTQCMAVATEVLDPLPACYQLTISEEDLRAFNRECGLLRYLLMDEAPAWAISCYGAYKLFAGPPETLEHLLGVPMPVARQAFLRFAEELEQGDSESLLLKMASRYANT